MNAPNDFASIPIGAMGALAGDASADFAVFLPGGRGGGPVLYRQAGADVDAPDGDRLRDHGVHHLLIRTGDLAKCESIVESKLTELLQHGELPPVEKVRIVHQVGTAVARDIAVQPQSAEGRSRMKDVVDNVVACVLSDPMVAGHMLHMAGHERTVASHMFIVSTLAVLLGAEVYGADEQMLRTLGLAGMMHDIGKLSIGTDILNKQAPLTPEELHLIEQHPIESVRLIGDDPQATPLVRQIVVQHHERIDGRGYPIGLSGSELLPGSRILSIVDTFHAMIGRRAYRAPMTPVDANRALSTLAGKQCDADILACWQSLFERRWTAGSGDEPWSPDAVRDEVSNRHEHRLAPPKKSLLQRPPRAMVSANVTVRCVYTGRLNDVSAAPEEFVASIQDISRRGLCMYTAHPMYRGEIVSVQIREGSQIVWIRSAVAWCRQRDANTYRTGLRFIERVTEREAHSPATVMPAGRSPEAGFTAANREPTEVNRLALAHSDNNNAEMKKARAIDKLDEIAAMRVVPIEAERTVTTLANADDADVRLRAIDVLAKIGSEASRHALLSMLSDAEAAVRERAVGAVGALQITEASGAVRKLLRDPVVPVALRAAGSLGRLGDRIGLTMVVATLKEGGPHARLAAHVFGQIVGHRFGANAEGVNSALRYLKAHPATATSGAV